MKGCERAIPPTTEVAGLLALIYEAEHYAITLRDELLRENRVKRGTQYARFAFFRTANRLNQYYKTATGQRVNNGDFPYNVYDANGGIVKPETKKTKKAV